jgi:hypothetical protein
MIAARLPGHDQPALRLSIKLVALLVDGAVVAATEQGEKPLFSYLIQWASRRCC